MYYEFISKKAIDMSNFEMILNSVIEDEFDFVTWDNYSGYIETGFSISSDLKQRLPILLADLGESIYFIGTPAITPLSRYMLTISRNDSIPYHSLADAINLALMNHDTKVREMFLDYFNQVPKELMDTIETFVEHGSNVLLVSKLLYIHRNTLNQRIMKFSDITGFDLRDVEHNQLVYLYKLVSENNVLLK